MLRLSVWHWIETWKTLWNCSHPVSCMFNNGNVTMTFVQFFSPSALQLREWNKVSFAPSVPEWIAHRQRQSTQRFSMNKPPCVSSQRFPCVICRGRWAELDKTPGKVKCTQRYWCVTQREERSWKLYSDAGVNKETKRKTGRHRSLRQDMGKSLVRRCRQTQEIQLSRVPCV